MSSSDKPRRPSDAMEDTSNFYDKYIDPDAAKRAAVNSNLSGDAPTFQPGQPVSTKKDKKKKK